MMRKLRLIVSPLLIAALVFAGIPMAMAKSQPPASLVSTDMALSAEQANADRERISEILAREDVQKQLLAQGVNPADVENRVAALSDQEVRQMAVELEELPAGAGVVGALFAVFVILLVTDILGLTNVFPFTR